MLLLAVPCVCAGVRYNTSRMSEIMKSLVGRVVLVYSGHVNECRDEGVVQEADDTAILVDSHGEILVFPLATVRLIKIVR
jgi:hypothetical protein